MNQSLSPLGTDFELWGLWWLPEEEAEPLSGQLSSRHGELQLKLLGHFASVDLNALWIKIPVIYGVAEAKAFTLWDAVQGPFSFKLPGTEEQNFEGMTVLVGNHLPPVHETRLSGLIIHSENLGPWSGVRPVEHTIQLGGQEASNISFALASDRSRDVSVTSRRIRLSFGSSVSTQNEEFYSYGFNCAPAVRVVFDEPYTVAEALSLADSLRRLFSLLVGVAFVAERVFLEIMGYYTSPHCQDHKTARVKCIPTNAWSLKHGLPPDRIASQVKCTRTGG